MVQATGRAMSEAQQRAGRPGDWSRDGWLLVAEFLSEDERALLCAEADRLWAQQELFAMRGAVPNSPARSDRLEPVIDLSEPFRALAYDAPLLALASELLGGKAQLMKDKLIVKPGGAGGYKTHQDAAYWQDLGIAPGDYLTAVVFLDDSTRDKGPIECVPGHHATLLTAPGAIADVEEGLLDAPFEAVEARAGDLLLLHSLTPHRSGPNRSAETRRTLLFTYAVDSKPDLYGRYRVMRGSTAAAPR